MWDIQAMTKDIVVNLSARDAIIDFSVPVAKLF
jgi:hypothetical protein